MYCVCIYRIKERTTNVNVLCLYLQDKGADYQCECPQGFHGQHCESSATSCEELPCQNGASCVSFYDSYQCRCLAGYSGVNCEREVDECSSNPCRNGMFTHRLTSFLKNPPQLIIAALSISIRGQFPVIYYLLIKITSLCSMEFFFRNHY